MGSKKLKIGLLLDDTLDTPDGVQQYVLTLGEWLGGKGHEVHYIVGASKRKDVANLHPLARVVRLKFNGNRVGTPLLASKRRIKELVDTLDLDVVHVQMPYSPLFAGRFINALPSNVRVVGSFHVLPSDNATKFGAKALKKLLGKSLERIDQMLSNTTSTAAFFKEAWGVESRVVPNPVHVGKFITNKRFDWDKDKLNVVFLGRMVERKGAANLVEAMTLLPPRVAKNIRLHMGGKGPLLKRIEEQIKLNDLEECVSTLGFISEEDKPAFLASADIAIFPSTGGESFGISVVEAMAAGSGVVLAGRNPGYNCVLGQRPDMMFDASDPQSIADALTKWSDSATERREAQSWLAEHVKQYDIGKSVGPQILAAYTK